MTPKLRTDEPRLRIAGSSDLPGIVALVNRAYEVERFIFDKDRTSPAEIQQMSQKGQFLLLESPEGELLGSVYVEKREERAYLGMLAIVPSQQRKGLGGRLIAAVEDHARTLGCTDLDLRVVSPRTELVFGRPIPNRPTSTSRRKFPGTSSICLNGCR